MSDKKRPSADTTPGMGFERPIQEIEEQLRELEELSERTELDISSEVEALRGKLEKTQGNISALAREIGLSRQSCYALLKKLGLEQS